MMKVNFFLFFIINLEGRFIALGGFARNHAFQVV
jgi:hypothetical protein